jgi:hypothetical protein
LKYIRKLTLHLGTMSAFSLLSPEDGSYFHSPLGGPVGGFYAFPPASPISLHDPTFELSVPQYAPGSFPQPLTLAEECQEDLGSLTPNLHALGALSKVSNVKEMLQAPNPPHPIVAKPGLPVLPILEAQKRLDTATAKLKHWLRHSMPVAHMSANDKQKKSNLLRTQVSEALVNLATVMRG